LAPEHKFPAAVHDVYDVFAYLTSPKSSLKNVDNKRVVVSGDSAGGNLAAVLCQMAQRNGTSEPIKLQALLCMAANDRNGQFISPSYKAYGEGYFLTRETMDFFYESYTDGVVIEDDDLHKLAPLKGTSLESLPPAYIAVASHDPLLADGEEYSQLLRQYNVPVTYKVFTGIHIFWMLGLAVEQTIVDEFTSTLVNQIEQAVVDKSKL